MRFALAALIFLLSACAAPPRPEADATPVSAAAAAPSDPAELLAYLARLRGVGEGALALEAGRQRQAATRERSDVARLKWAIALSLSLQSEESDILAIVEPIARREAAPAEVRGVASFLQTMAHERRRLKEAAAASAARARDERKALEAQRQRAEALQERAAQLQQKLDALTELEKSLSDRQAPSR